MALAVAAWQALTPAQQSAWAAFGARIRRVDRLGQTHSRTGYAAFISCFISTDAVMGAPGPNDPPDIGVYQVETVDVTTDAFAALSITWAYSPSALDNYLRFEISQAVSSGVTFGPGPRGWANLTSAIVSAVQPFTLASGRLPGDWFFIRVREWRNPDGALTVLRTFRLHAV